MSFIKFSESNVISFQTGFQQLFFLHTAECNPGISIRAQLAGEKLPAPYFLLKIGSVQAFAPHF